MTAKAKNSPADTAVNDADNDEKGKRHRSKRDVTYVAYPQGTKAEIFTMPGAEWNESVAIEALKKKLGSDCVIEGPFYKVKGNNTDTDSISVKVTLRELKLSPKQYEGSFAGWRFFANGIKKCTINGESFADNDLLQVEFESLVDESNKSPKPRFGRNVMIRRAALDDCMEAKSA